MTHSIEELLRKIEDLERRLTAVEQTLQQAPPYVYGAGKPSLGSSPLLDLPDALRKTIMSMQSIGEADAQTLATRTGRTRSVENIYLNQLTRLGYLSKVRKGKKVYFRVTKYY
ncbi:MAG: hypothetical protein HYU39_06625 [Thaumarchaeota archaeon]|nr:hypothetical protein [Nitrososphaerota archaeon]